MYRSRIIRCKALRSMTMRVVMAPSCRWSSRLRSANLTYDELLLVAEDLLHEASPAARASVDVMLSVRSPLPEWAVNSVLVSTDLIPYLFASLEMQDWAAACVCKAWRPGLGRHYRAAPRTTRRAALGKLDCVQQDWAAHPSGEWLAMATSANSYNIGLSTDMRLVDPAMCTLQTIPAVAVIGIAVSDDFIYTTHAEPPCIQSYNARPPFSFVREYRVEVEQYHSGIIFPCLGPNTMLYVIAFPFEYEDVASRTRCSPLTRAHSSSACASAAINSKGKLTAWQSSARSGAVRRRP